MENFNQYFKKMSKLEKSLLGVIFGGVFLGIAIPEEYSNFKVVPLMVSGVACAGLALEKIYREPYDPYKTD